MVFTPKAFGYKEILDQAQMLGIVVNIFVLLLKV